jgi:hypothetical protein
LIVYGEESASLPGVPLVRIGGTERTTASSPHLGEIVVYGVDSARQPAAPLVQIGGRKGNAPEAANHGQIAVNGIVNAFVVEAEGMQAAQINADNYFFRRVPFAPLVKSIPGVSPADQLRAQQLQQPPNPSPNAAESGASGNARQEPATAEDAPTSSDDAESPAAETPAETSPQAE